jgi:hypothetical protein
VKLMKSNPSRWVQGQSGNLNGRRVGARGRFSQRFVADLADAWEERGATALERTAMSSRRHEYPRWPGLFIWWSSAAKGAVV